MQLQGQGAQMKQIAKTPFGPVGTCLVLDFVIRPAVFAAAAEIYNNKRVDKAQREQLLAQDDFRLHAGLQGSDGQTCAP